MAQVVAEAGFAAEGEGGADLNSGSAVFEGLVEFSAMSIAAGQPERNVHAAKVFEVDLIARAVDRLAGFAEQELAARRSIVSAGGGAFDHEAVDLAGGAAEEAGGEGAGRDDGEEVRANQRGQGCVDVFGRIEAHGSVFALTGDGSGDGEPVFGGAVGGQSVEHAGNLSGDARAHQDVAHAREHGSVDGGEVGQLHLFEEVDADGIGVAFAGEEDLHEVGDHAELDELAGFAALMHGGERIGSVGGFSAGDEVVLPDAARDFGEGKRVQSAAHVTALIAVGEAAYEDLVEGGSGDDSELSGAGDGLRQAPVGDSDSHASLDDSGELDHPDIVSDEAVRSS